MIGQFAGLTVITVGYEGHVDDGGRHRFATHDQVECGPGSGACRLDVAHGNRAGDGRAEPSRRHGSDCVAGGILNFGALACGSPASGLDANALARRAVCNLALNAGGPGEASFLPAPFLD